MKKEFRLTPWQRRQLRRRLQATDDAHLYRRTLALLEIDRGRSVVATARLLRVARSSIYRWIERFAPTGRAATLLDQCRPGRSRRWSEELESVLSCLLEERPNQLGFLSANWTVPLLREAIAEVTGQFLSKATLRRRLHEMDYVWKRCRYVLRPDPELEKKTPHPPPIAAVGVTRGGAVLQL
jgi:transposase